MSASRTLETVRFDLVLLLNASDQVVTNPHYVLKST